jgi:hypothetical protein
MCRAFFPFVIKCVLRARSPRFLPRDAVPRGVILLLEVKLKHDATLAQKKNLRKFYSERWGQALRWASEVAGRTGGREWCGRMKWRYRTERESEDFLPSRFLAASLIVQEKAMML